APSLRTVDVIDLATGMPTIETLSGKTLGVSATGAYGHEMAQAGAVNRAGNDLITQLEDPTNRAILGQLSSYIKQGTLGTPLADARAAKMSAQLKTFAALQPAMHGFRAASAQQAFEKIIGGLAQDPDATIAAIQGILQTAGEVNPNLNAAPTKTNAQSKGAPPKVGTVEGGYRFKGGDPSKSSNWE